MAISGVPITPVEYERLAVQCKGMRMLPWVLIATSLARADWFESVQKAEAFLEQGRTDEAIGELTAALKERQREAAAFEKRLDDYKWAP